MRYANIDGRAHIQTSEGYVDIAKASRDRFPADAQSCFDYWPELVEWAKDQPWRSLDVVQADDVRLRAPVPRPRQIFAVGLNYRAHAEETGLRGSAEMPLTFTKFASSVAGPYGDLTLPSAFVDWEIELVVVIGRPAHRVDESRAWAAVAGLTIGQDFSDRSIQMQGDPPQFSLGKSYPGFAPIGPVVVTVDEFSDPDDIRLRCVLNDDVVQDGRTSNLIHSIPRLIAMYSQVCPLYPGDLIFSGTPDGVGMGRKPPRYLVPGDRVRSVVEGIGEMTHECRAQSAED
jgi:2-keto-4-pentenoate hydratase/2-oxohepta-3-ene-1,7-dioic acid hydratase in catechol pathway